MNTRFYLLICLILGLAIAQTQAQNSRAISVPGSVFFVSVNAGYQMSGIKDEDFVRSNYTPLFNISAGKWFSPFWALQIGYKGFYFNYIEDDIRHHYDYFYGEAVFNLNNFIFLQKANKSWGVLVHGGAGYFYNHSYLESNCCVNVGMQNYFYLSNDFQATLDISSIMGWDIYQGNEDILPAITLGITYFINNHKDGS